MAFKETFPLEIEFEIDREMLVRYYQCQGLLGLTVATIPAAILISVGFSESFLVLHHDFTFLQKIATVVCFGFGGVLAGLLTALFFYFAYFHRSAQLAAKNLRLRVEGPYLRLVSGG